MNRIKGINSMLIGAAALLVLSSTSCSEKRYADPLTPEEALEEFQLDENFEIEIFAAEPYIQDPVSMIFDEKGNAYVVEMPDYPYKPEPGQGKGRIMIIRDTDGDGRIDSSSVFAEGISEATSMLPWQGGLIVTAAPYILYLKDTNGDNVADVQEKLFSGFFENNSEAQITNLRFGVDNWIYASNHGQAGNVKFSRKPNAPELAMSGADFRFRLDRDEFELETGAAQFGQTLNDWGHRFFTHNTIHIRQSIIPWRYTHRHTFLPSTVGSLNISDHELEMFQLTPAPYWRAERSARRQAVFDEQGVDKTEWAEDHFTGASGGTVYTGDVFGEEYYGSIFTGDVSGALVHRDVLVPHETAPHYIAKRAPEDSNKEFLASTDSWFRPSNFTVGPDGMLYVVDMYRQHIETPVSIPDDLKEDMDFMRGSDMGRIYRIVPKSKKQGKVTSDADGERLTSSYVELLSHPNQWWRLQAQRVLLERQDKSIIPAVSELFNSSSDARARLHSLYVLEGLNALNAGMVIKAMNDSEPGVREHGAILAERFPECLNKLIALTDDATPRVRFQAALSLGEFSAGQSAAALVKVIEKNYGDQWFRTAVLSSNAGTSSEFVNHLVNNPSFFSGNEEGKGAFIHDLAYVFGARNNKGEAAKFINTLSAKAPSELQNSYLTGLKKGLEKSTNETKVDQDLSKALTNLAGSANAESKKVIEEIKKL